MPLSRESLEELKEAEFVSGFVSSLAPSQFGPVSISLSLDLALSQKA
jgi:hypothetical protein